MRKATSGNRFPVVIFRRIGLQLYTCIVSEHSQEAIDWDFGILAPRKLHTLKNCAKKLRLRPKVARSTELISNARVPDIGACCRGGSEISPPPRAGGPASIPNTRSVEEYPSGHHTILGSSFCGRCLSEGGSIDFQGQLFCLPADLRQTLRDFCPCPGGSDREKKSGVGVPLCGGI